MRTPFVFSALATALLASASARAQEVTKLPETTVQSVGLDAGLDQAFVARAAYQHRLELPAVTDSRLYGRFTLPIASPDLGDWTIDGGLRTTLVHWRDLRLLVLAGPVVKRNTNRLFSALGIGLGATVLAGYEGPVWGLSGELGYEQLFTTSINHSVTYHRELGDAAAKDGWYAFTGNTFRGGLRGGARIGSVEIAARAGVTTTGQFSPIIPPFYATLGTSYAF